MKTVVIKVKSDNQLDLLVHLAAELNIEIEVTDDEKAEKAVLVELSETSFSKDWENEDDEVWTEFLNKKPYVPKR
jgi:hypothetical protein